MMMLSALKKIFNRIMPKPYDPFALLSDPFFVSTNCNIGSRPSYTSSPSNSISSYSVGNLGQPAFTIGSSGPASYQIDTTGDPKLIDESKEKVQLVFDGYPLISISLENKSIPKLISLLTQSAIKNETIQDNPLLEEALKRLMLILKLSL